MIKRLLKLVKAFLPRRLPTGLAAFNAWADSILAYSGLELNPKNRLICAGFILQLPPTWGFVSVHKASSLLIKAAANQVSASVLKEGLNGSQEVPPTTAEVGPKAS